jgi:DNA polymerase III alpha subunit
VKVLRAIGDETKAPIIKERFKVKIPDTRRRPKIREALQEFDGRELFDTKAQRIVWEQFYLGISLSGSEADIYNAKDKCFDLVRKGQPDDSFEIAVCVDAIREIVCKNGKSAGKSMAFVTARDKTYVMDNIVVFPNVFGAAKALLDEGSVLKIKGRIDDRGSLVADKVERLK